MIDDVKSQFDKVRIVNLLRLGTMVLVVLCLLGDMSACSGTDPIVPVRAQGQKLSQVVRDYEVLLVPNLQGGVAGWCLTVVQEGVRGCAAPRTSLGGVFAEGCEPTKSSNVEVYALTNSDVKTVSIGGGPAVATRATAALIGGLRSVVVEIQGSANMVSRDREFCPSVTLVGSRGSSNSGRGLQGPPLEVVLAGRQEWRRPKPLARGVCELRTVHLDDYVPRWGNVVTRMSASRVFDGGFVSCVDSEYFSPEEASMDAAVLLNAARPGATPNSLPGLTALPGHPGIFEAPGSEGELVARRIPHAWLVVEEGGTGIAEALILLAHLRATVGRV
jgi:hypothetical protein